MKKIIALLALLPALVFAQSYPSPTYKNLTVNGSFLATGAASVALNGPQLILNDTSGTNVQNLAYQSNGSFRWIAQNSAANTYGIERFVSGSFVDTPFSISNSTGVVNLPDGVTSTAYNQNNVITSTGVLGNCPNTIPSTNYCVNYWQLGTSTFDDIALNDPTAFVNELVLLHNYGGAQMTGGRQTFYVQSTLASPSSASNGNRNYVAGVFYAQAASGDGGTNSGSSATSKGAIFSLNPVAVSYNGATNLLELTGAEFDIAAQAGSSMWYKAGLTVVETNSDAVQGSVYDTAIGVSNGTTSTFWNNGILFGPMNGKWPFGSTSCIICTTGSGTAQRGIDFSSATLSNFLVGPGGFSVSGAGQTFTTALSAQSSNAVVNINDTSATNNSNLFFLKNGTNVWNLFNASASGTLNLQRFVAGVSTDTPISVSNSTGVVTFADGIQGSTSGTTPACNSGLVGALCTATTSGTSLTTTTAANGTSVSLPAGDWDVQCSNDFVAGTGSVATLIEASVGTTSATIGGLGQNAILSTTFSSGGAQWISTPVWQINVSATTTAYCPVEVIFSGGTMTVSSFIRARKTH